MTCGSVRRSDLTRRAARDAWAVATTAEQRAAAARVVRARLDGTAAKEVISALNLEGVAP